MLVVAYLLGAGLVAVIVYALARRTRKTYTCSLCGEKVLVEQMEAARCSSCGAELRQDGDLAGARVVGEREDRRAG